MCPVGSQLFPGLFPSNIVCHCLLMETADRLVLVDTGLGLMDLAHPSKLGANGRLLRPGLDPHFTAFEQVKSKGFSPKDVTDIIPTHLDLDHAGGIQDFPSARVHVDRKELAAARARKGILGHGRYRPHQLPGTIQWREFETPAAVNWNGFGATQSLADLPAGILLVSLPGHTAGHTGVAVKEGERWHLHAGDSYYHRAELKAKGAPRGLGFFQRFVHEDYAKARETQVKLAPLQSQLNLFCAHDPDELAAQ